MCVYASQLISQNLKNIRINSGQSRNVSAPIDSNNHIFQYLHIFILHQTNENYQKKCNYRCFTQYTHIWVNLKTAIKLNSHFTRKWWLLNPATEICNKYFFVLDFCLNLVSSLNLHWIFQQKWNFYAMFRYFFIAIEFGCSILSLFWIVTYLLFGPFGTNRRVELKRE